MKPVPLPQPRLLILIVAYNAESTLCAVLDRIPSSVLADYDCEVLVIDDASSDTTFERGLSYRQSRPELPLTVLRNRTNQGYGGNQKLGYRYAITEGFDYVALVHGDGQYAPEDLPRLLMPLDAGSTDAVFGSRMLIPGAARRGGMPLYKLIGNKVLTTTQNRLSGLRLSEWHSGYRIYRVSSLAGIRFTANRDDFGFDTEIILQLLNADAGICELPIPTYYGDELCRVDGIKYAGQVIAATLRNALHRSGLRYRRSLAPLDEGNGHYDVKLAYSSSHSEALARVCPGSRVLDLGAGPGAFATALADRGAVVATADKYAPTTLDPRVTSHVVDLNEAFDLPLGDYDQVLMLDVIEHLADPEAFLEGLRFRLGDRSRELVLTTPNVAFLATRLMLLGGQFNYSHTGILDRTHTRLFTFRSLRRTLTEAGFDLLEVKGIPAPFPKVLGDGWIGRFAIVVNRALIAILPGLFSYQILVVASSRPHVDHILRTTRASIEIAAA